MIASQTIKDIAPTLAVIAVVVGAAWAILAENHESRIEFQKGISELRVEIREENAKTRVEIEGLRGDIERLDDKLDDFKDSHEREHDLFYGQGDSENPTPPN